MQNQNFMKIALEEAQKAFLEDEVPIGAVLIGREGQILAQNHNRIEQLQDPSAHAEVLVIREAAQKLGDPRLRGCHLYTTLEPCSMCAGLISLARVELLVFGAADIKGGGVLQGPKIFDQPTCHHRPQVFGGFLEQASALLLQEFFQQKRREKK